MNESKALILGCSGLALTPDEKAFYREHRHWGFILFGRNIGDAAQISDLIASMRESVGWEAPVLIDQEGGRVQRIKPPILQAYPSAQVLGDIYRQDREKGLRAAWLMSRLHAFDLKALGFTMDCRGDASLKVYSPAFVQPTTGVLVYVPVRMSPCYKEFHLQVLPASIRNQITTPAMCQFMRNNINVLAITADNSGSCERVNRILHAYQTLVT